VDTINAGISPITGMEPGLQELVAEVVGSGRFRATWDYRMLADRDVVLICVETPVDENNIPRYEALRSALSQLGPVMKVGALVIVESTIARDHAGCSAALPRGFQRETLEPGILPGKLS
jgi:UDP-N-acetyl-D-mannosaminuronic acid dehydrogenase